MVSVDTEDDVLRFYSLRSKDGEVDGRRGWLFLVSKVHRITCLAAISG